RLRGRAVRAAHGGAPGRDRPAERFEPVGAQGAGRGVQAVVRAAGQAVWLGGGIRQGDFGRDRARASAVAGRAWRTALSAYSAPAGASARVRLRRTDLLPAVPAGGGPDRPVLHALRRAARRERPAVPAVRRLPRRQRPVLHLLRTDPHDARSDGVAPADGGRRW